MLPKGLYVCRTPAIHNSFDKGNDGVERGPVRRFPALGAGPVGHSRIMGELTSILLELGLRPGAFSKNVHLARKILLIGFHLVHVVQNIGQCGGPIRGLRVHRIHTCHRFRSHTCHRFRSHTCHRFRSHTCHWFRIDLLDRSRERCFP
jgi:hypothetical protein